MKLISLLKTTAFFVLFASTLLGPAFAAATMRNPAKYEPTYGWCVLK